MKKYVILSMTLLFVLSFAACTDKTTGENNTTTEKNSTQASDTSVYDDGFGELIDGKELDLTKASDTDKNSGTDAPSTTKSSATSAESDTTVSSEKKTSEADTETLKVEEFSGGDSEDFGELF